MIMATILCYIRQLSALAKYNFSGTKLNHSVLVFPGGQISGQFQKQMCTDSEKSLSSIIDIAKY